MKKFILVSSLVSLVSLSARAEKLCAIGGGTWSTTFSDMSYGWIGGATSYYLQNDGNTTNLTTNALAGASATWRVKKTDTATPIYIYGRHRCSTLNSSSGDPTGTNGPNCYCQRVSVNGELSLGVWILIMSIGSAEGCIGDNVVTGCAYSCASTVASSNPNSRRATILAVLMP